RHLGRTLEARPPAYRRIGDAVRLRRTHRRPHRARCVQRTPLRAFGRCATAVEQHHEPLGQYAGCPMKLPRFARLLPSVVIVGTGLLVLNASGLIHDAYAGSAQSDAMAPPPAPANKDFAADDGQTASAS